MNEIAMRHATSALLLVAAALAPASRPAQAQSLNPSYLSEFPTVERVKQAMQVADPRQTALRQMGAFWQLQEIIKQLSGSREFRGVLPDEKKLLDAYWTAAYTIGESAKLSDDRGYAYMRNDPRFGVEGIEVFKTLLPPDIHDRFNQSVGGETARHVAQAKASEAAGDSAGRADMRRMAAKGVADTAGTRRLLDSAAAEMKKGSKEQRQIRRCVESGRSETQCLTEAVGKSFSNMFGWALDGLGLKPAPIVGLRVIGTFPGPGKFALSFSNESVSVSCADLEPQILEYTTTMTPGGLRIAFAGNVLPFPFTMRADGRLAGPAEADIPGQVITGYQHGTRTYTDGRTEPISRPVYEPRTRRCAIGTLAVSSPTTQLASASALPAAALNLLLGGTDQKIMAPIPTGLRLSGEYGSQAALDVDFRPEGAVVGCGDVVILRQYVVRLQGAQVMVEVQNGATPFTLVLGADGKLTGSGTVKVEGRAITGSSPNGDFTYVPRSASCTLGVLAIAG